MAEYNAPASLITPWGTLNFNQTSAPGYIHDASKCDGLDMPALRVVSEDRPVTDGGFVHKGWLSARHVVLGGDLWALSITARQTLEDNLISALASIMAADGTYQWVLTTETTTYTRSITVRCEIGLTTTGGFQKSYTFGLVAADPTILEDGDPHSGSGGANPGGGGAVVPVLTSNFEVD